MSATYEQKRYYVDPSRLSKSDLDEIQSQNMKALSLATAPQQSGFVTNQSSSQKSPSLSSTHSDPSPVLNNLRTTFNQLHQNGKPSRLASSITLPDIKPLASLIGPSASISADLSTLSLSSSSLSSGTNPSAKPNNNPAPISFINNLVPSSNGETQHKVINNQSPWGDSQPLGMENGGSGSTNDFNPNFADFDDAFNNSSNNNHFNGGSSPQTNGFNGTSHTINNVFPTSNFPLPLKMVNGGFQPFPASASNMQQPLLPHHGNGFTAPPTGISNGVVHTSPSVNSIAVSDSSGDKYAALKDLDSLFKQSKL